MRLLSNTNEKTLSWTMSGKGPYANKYTELLNSLFSYMQLPLPGERTATTTCHIE